MKKNKSIDRLKKEGKATTANKISVTDPKHLGWEFEQSDKKIKEKGEWVSLIENFCNLEGITAAELIEGYKLSKKKFKGAGELKQGKEPIIQDFTKENAVGKPYNPFNNPLFASKIDKAPKK